MPASSLHTDYRTSRKPPEARSRTTQTQPSHARRYECHATTRTKSRPFQFSLGQIAFSSVLPDLRLLSERLLFYWIFALNLSILHCGFGGNGITVVFTRSQHTHTLPSKRWVVRMCCIYCKMAEASRPGIGYTYRLIFFSSSSTDRLIAVGFRGWASGLDGGCCVGNPNTPLGSSSRNCEVGLARSFFRMTAAASLVSLPFHDLGGSAHSGLLACEGAGWYRAHCMSLISGPTPEETPPHPPRTEPNRTHTFLIHRKRRIRHAALCWKIIVVCTSSPLPPPPLPLVENLSYETNRHKTPGYRERGPLTIQTTLRP